MAGGIEPVKKDFVSFSHFSFFLYTYATENRYKSLNVGKQKNFISAEWPSRSKRFP